MSPAAETTPELPFGAGPGTGEQQRPLSVSELVGLIGDALARDFADVVVSGEISKWTAAASGHCYFTLSDEDARIDAVMWRSDAARLRFEPQVGDEVVCRGKVGVYGPQGRMQLYATTLQPVGWGAAQRALEQLKRKLAEEGLFAEERKRPLPLWPATVGVVTSRVGAAVHDILTTIARRSRGTRVLISPAQVQGDEAPASLVAALELLAEEGSAEVVIIGRGGGATEDLAAFNDEAVVRAVATFPVPVVSAVGHEVDITLCDLAADRRAATPTAAAELVVPVRTELVEQIDGLATRLRGAMVGRLRHLRLQVGDASGRLREPATRVAVERQRLDEMAVRLERALSARARMASDALARVESALDRSVRARLHEWAARVAETDATLRRAALLRAGAAARKIAELGSKLDALSPLAVLDRGYSLVTGPAGRLVRSAAEIRPGDKLGLRFARGGARATVIDAYDGEEEE